MLETIKDHVNRYLQLESPDTNMLHPPQVLALALAAVRKYLGYAELSAHRTQRLEWEQARAFDPSLPKPTPAAINQELVVSASEWAIISELWHLYMEREQAKQLEATRSLGADTFGRSTSEIQADINQAHTDLPLRAFSFEIVTI